LDVHNIFYFFQDLLEQKEDLSKFKPLIKLYDRADIINDIA